MPVGLFGEARKITAGRSRSIAASIAARSSVKSGLSGDADETHARIERVRPVHDERRLGREHRRTRPGQRGNHELDQLVRAIADDQAERVGNRQRAAQRRPQPRPSRPSG